MNELEQERLRQTLRKLAEQTAQREPPREIADALLLHFVESHRPSKWRKVSALMWRWRAGMGVAVAAALVLAWTSLREPTAPPVADTAPRFIALPYVIQPAVNEPTRVVRAQVMAAELIAVGLAVSGDPSAQFDAEILVGQDGRARAVRLMEENE